MSATRRPTTTYTPRSWSDRWLLGILFVGAYTAALAYALLFERGPDQIVLIWPAAGIGFALLATFGLGWWWVIPLSLLLAHLSFLPVPASFLPFSLASNTLATVLATAWLRRHARQHLASFRIHAGFVLLGGVVLMGAISAAIGVPGMVFAGMLDRSALPSAAVKWLLSDAFGTITVAPFLMLLKRHLERSGWAVFRPESGWRERGLWLLAHLLALAAVAWIGRVGSSYALALSGLPLVTLIWSALRFGPLLTAFATMLTTIYMATLIGIGAGGFETPKSLLEITTVLVYLSVYAIVPVLIAATSYERQLAQRALLDRARQDVLTGLPNRFAFEEDARRLLTELGGAGETMALLYLDLDQFKLVNDTISHAAGDEMLRELAGVVAAQVRPGDLLARLGGDEFGLLLRDCPPEAAQARAKAVLDDVRAFRFASSGRVLGTDASIGLVLFSAGDAPFAELMRQADAACYTAKELGGGRVQIHGARAVIERTDAMQWALSLSEALEHDRFQLYAQRIHDLRGTAQRIDLEILLRLPGRDDRVTPTPDQVIKAAERFNLAARLDRWVIQHVLEWFEARPEWLERVGRISINLSAATLADEDGAEAIRTRLERSALGPDRLCFELTETSAVRDLNRARQFIERFRRMGVAFALDDFGTGFCSFAYLRDLEVDVFKIDGSFVRAIERSPLALAIVRSIVEIAAVLGRRTIAEAIESEAQLAALRHLGVGFGQGYFLHRPEPLERLFPPDGSPAPAPAEQ